jgi:hypothetical protein
MCCQKKNIEGCWECDYFEDCSTLDWLLPVNAELNINNIKEIRTTGPDKFINEISGEEFCDFYEN